MFWEEMLIVNCFWKFFFISCLGRIDFIGCVGGYI